MVVGGALLPKLNVQYSPRSESNRISVSFGYQAASARVVEQEVTSKIEGALNALEGVIGVTASSYYGGGSVTLTFKKGTKMEAARFAVATQIRQIYDRLPEGVSYPSVSSSISGNSSSSLLLSYTINADMTADRIVNYAQDLIVTPLSRVEGVESVRTSGAQPFEWVITFDPKSLRSVGLTPSDLSSAFNEYFHNNIVGSMVVDEKLMLLKLRSEDLNVELERIPIRMVNGRLFYIGDFATISYQEQEPNYYSRYNGLNTINVTVYAQEGINSIKVAEAVREKMTELQKNFPDNYTIKLDYDSSVSLKEEIHKIFKRALFSLLILLCFVLAVSRSFKYLGVISISITANLLIAVIFYYMLGIDIELYSMAGITVSLGIIIDTAIVMTDHYSYYKDRSVAFSITGALLTTIAAMTIIFFLPEEQKRNLIGFVWVIILNLSLSLFIAFLFIPAMLEKISLNTNGGVVNSSWAYKRWLVGMSAFYCRYIEWGRQHRWIYIVVFVLGFGLPIRLLPSQVARGKEYRIENGVVHFNSNPDRYKGGLVGLYNITIGSRWYQKNKGIFEKALGGAFNLFKSKENSLYNIFSNLQDDENRRVQLYVTAQMPEGTNARQMNKVMLEMENWLSQYNQIESYQTDISGNYGSMTINFKKKYERTAFPHQLKQQLWTKAIGYGAATWYVSALDKDDHSLSNSVEQTSYDHTIPLYGYNYDLLYRYAQILMDSLKTNKRVSATGLSANWGRMAGNEYTLDLNKEKIVRNNMDVANYSRFLRDQLFNSSIGSVFDGRESTSVRLVSSEADYFDLWHITNDMVVINGIPTRMSDVGSLTKSKTSMTITRENQQYMLMVGFNFIGSSYLCSKMQTEKVKNMNKILPLGFSVGNDSYGYYYGEQGKKQTGLILIVIIAIFMICSIMTESLVKPLVIIFMIPLGIIGLFLIYPICDAQFGNGGFASMVMLCGIVVNAGIYIMSEYRTVSKRSQTTSVRCYIKAYNRKIIPTLLTIVSTILGLVPFLFDGKKEAFWFSFAIGVMGGMTMSILALVLYFPIFMPFKLKKDNE